MVVIIHLADLAWLLFFLSLQRFILVIINFWCRAAQPFGCFQSCLTQHCCSHLPSTGSCLVMALSLVRLVILGQSVALSHVSQWLLVGK